MSIPFLIGYLEAAVPSDAEEVYAETAKIKAAQGGRMPVGQPGPTPQLDLDQYSG